MTWTRIVAGSCGLLICILATGQSVRADQAALAHWVGSDFKGGAAELFGSMSDGEQVNYVYAAPTGPHSTMQVRFELSKLPAEQQFVHLKARDDDGPEQSQIRIELNGTVLFAGANSFTNPAWQNQKFAIPDGLLKPGENTLVIACVNLQGKAGMPPWFQVAQCLVGPREYVIRRDIEKDLYVVLPEQKREFPEPLPAGKQPGFKWRGIKSWMWRPEQCLAEIPVLARCKMNFFMNCYGAMCDLENYKWGDPNINRWWEELPAWKKTAYEEIVRLCRKHDITFCFSMNPNLCSKRFVNTGNPEDIDALWQHYAWMQGLGVQWFNISLDDITQGIDAAGQAKVVNEIFRRLRAKDSQSQMIFCPTYYWGDGTDDKARPYLEILARELHPEVYVFWTGDAVVGRITRKGADTYRSIVKHRIFLWDNYPVNDDHPTMHLGPVMKRDEDLCEVIDGYMSNPLCKQNQANRIPMLTCADYAWNPYQYDADRSIGQAILHLADTEAQRLVLRDLTEVYAGMLAYGTNNPGFNSVLAEYQRISSAPHARQSALAYIDHLRQLLERMNREFPNNYQPEKSTLANDIDILQQKYVAKYK